MRSVRKAILCVKGQIHVEVFVEQLKTSLNYAIEVEFYLDVSFIIVMLFSHKYNNYLKMYYPL